MEPKSLKRAVNNFFTKRKNYLKEQLSVTTWNIDGCLFDSFEIDIRNTYVIQWILHKDIRSLWVSIKAGMGNRGTE